MKLTAKLFLVTGILLLISFLVLAYDYQKEYQNHNPVPLSNNANPQLEKNTSQISSNASLRFEKPSSFESNQTAVLL